MIKYQMQNKKVKSFGIIPIFKDEGGFKILIVKNSKGGHWGLPKGTPENNEEPTQTAVRELFEETGIKDIEIDPGVTFSENYSFEINGVNYDKTNVYYLCFVNKMTKGDNLDQIDEIKWVSFDEARQTLVHYSVIGTVNRLEAYLLS